MAISGDTLRLAAGIRVTVGATVDDTTATLVRAWAAAWNALLPEWVAAMQDAAQTADGDRRAWRAWARQDRARRALAATAEALTALSKDAAVTISAALPTVMDTTAAGHPMVIASQMPPGIDWARVDTRALDAIVRRTTRQITARTRPISRDATAAIRTELVRGIAAGTNPRTVAGLMLDRVKGEFAGGLTRAMVIARTEMLDAHRAASHAADQAAADVLTGWQWQATLSTRTCPACLAMHGTTHPVTEPGPLGHPACRCTRLPVVKPWRDLGVDIPEPEPLTQDARVWFHALRPAEQEQVMGRKRLALLNDDPSLWGRLAVRRDNPDWRPSYQTRPVTSLPQSP